jgi:hypothetical protein
MLISDNKKFMFYHVYKVAGSSIRNSLIPYCSKKQVLLQNLNYGLTTLGLDLSFSPIYKFHPRLQLVKDFLGDDVFNSYYKFSFVRHPLDWQKSLYYFMIKNQRHHQHKLISKFSFEDYLKWRMDNELNLMSNILSDNKGNLLTDDVFKFENIDMNFQRVCKKLEIKAELPHKNIAGKDKKVKVSDATLIEFKNAFKPDFVNFNYDL